MAEAVAGGVELGVRGVLAIVDAGGVADGDGVGPGQREDGADEPQGGHSGKGSNR